MGGTYCYYVSDLYSRGMTQHQAIAFGNAETLLQVAEHLEYLDSLPDATHLHLINHYDDRTGASVGMWAQLMGDRAAPIEWGAILAPRLGPCQLQSSPLCTNVAVMERLDPMAMAPVDPAPASVIPTCQECFDHRSDAYLAAVAR